MIDAADALAFDVPFAKVVSTPEGDALLIGGKVFNVTGPDGNAALLLATAMRRVSQEECTSGSVGDMGAASSALYPPITANQ